MRFFFKYFRKVLNIKFHKNPSDFNEIIFLKYFRKVLHIKFHKNPSSGSRVLPCGKTKERTDRLEEANSRFSQFCESTLKSHILK
jgi:hypothetical protein